MNVHFIQHETFEAPGAYEQWAIQRKHHVIFSKVYEKQPLPQTAENLDLLIVIGGSQSPDTTLQECPYFDATAELACIPRAIRAGKAVVGVCLGAQLIGQALGVKYERSPEKEIGVLPVQLTDEDLKDNKIKHFDPMLEIGHWHSGMPE